MASNDGSLNAEPAHIEESQVRRKRVKIDVACNPCRASKVKCDGLRPVCSRCSRRPNSKTRCVFVDEGEGPLKTRQHLQHASAPGRTEALAASSHHSVPSTSDPSPLATDSMTGVADRVNNAGAYFGGSSAASFTRQIKAAIDARLGCSRPPTTGSSPPNGADHEHSASVFGAMSGGIALENRSYFLPSRRQANHLTDVYWTYVDPLYPFLNKAKWQTMYDGLFAGTLPSGDERLFISTLNVIFAISTQLQEGTTAEQRQASSDAYFHKAQSLLKLHPWQEEGTVELVQCLLMVSQYLQSTNQPLQTWLMVGSAIRVAQALGFHLPGTAQAMSSDASEQETLRRVWHGCVLMDRMVCMTHGRPAMISSLTASGVPMPRYNDTGESDARGHFAFFVSCVKLYELTHQAVVGQAEESASEDLTALLKLDRALANWKRQLPPHLCLSSYLYETGTFDVRNRQAVIIELRFLHAQILVYRPALARFCLTHKDLDVDLDSLTPRIFREGALRSVEVAQSIVNILTKYKSNDGTVGLLPAWWYRIYYVYTAATVLLAATFRPDFFDMASIDEYWVEVVELLQRECQFGQSARRCLAALQILASKVSAEAPGAATSHGRVPNGASSMLTYQNSHLVGGDGDGSFGVHHAEETAMPQLTSQHALNNMELDGQELLTFDVHDFTWLNDVNAWGVFNG